MNIQRKKKATCLLSAYGSHPGSVSSLEKQNGFVWSWCKWYSTGTTAIVP